MHNRYKGRNPALTSFDAEKLYDREKIFNALHDHVISRRSAVLMGVEGGGKSSVLNCFFTIDYRRKMAREKKILIRVTDFPLDRDSDGVYQYLAEGVRSTVDMLDQTGLEEEYQMVQKMCNRKTEKCLDAASRFQLMCEAIQEAGYCILLVIDGFERFVSSPKVSMEHHNIMNSLIAKSLSYIVATDYDFNRDSLPKQIEGSFLLMKFSGNEVLREGLTLRACSNLVEQGDFSEEEIKQMWNLSGGIPMLFRFAAAHVYQLKQDGATDWTKVFNLTYDDAKPLMENWCKILTKMQVTVLKQLVNVKASLGMAFENSELRSAAEQLLERGILVHPVEVNGEKPITSMYKYNTPLLRAYCREHELVATKQGKVIDVRGLEDLPMTGQELVTWYETWAEANNYPRPVNFSDELSEAMLDEYQLSCEVFQQYSEEVRNFIRMGICVDQTLLSVRMEDRSPAFIQFAKALEMHLNKTLVPIIQRIEPDYLIGNKRIEDIHHLMLGQIVFVLNTKHRVGSFVDEAGIFCENHELAGFSGEWWENVRKALSEVQERADGKMDTAANIRNDMAHPGFVSDKSGTNLLRMMFLGENSLFNVCQRLRDAAAEQGLL